MNYDGWKLRGVNDDQTGLPNMTKECDECGSAHHWSFYDCMDDDGALRYTFKCKNIYAVAHEDCVECMGEEIVYVGGERE